MAVLRAGFASWCLENRVRLRLTQRDLAARAGISRGYLARVEAGTADPTIGVVERVAKALGIEVSWWIREPVIQGPARTHDDAHARCSGYARRRLSGTRFLIAPEVEIIHGRSHGWIDLLAYDPVERVLVVIEIKTRIDDVGAIERQIGWYERSAIDAARRLGWDPITVTTWLLALATAENDDIARHHHDILDSTFPTRAPAAMAWLRGDRLCPDGRVLALIDPASHRREWLMRTKTDGRRSPAPYLDVGEADRSRGRSSAPSHPCSRQARFPHE